MYFKNMPLPLLLRQRKVGEKREETAYGTGVELRFKIRGDAATIRLRAEEAAEAQTAYIYYGSFQGGWENSNCEKNMPLGNGWCLQTGWSF